MEREYCFESEISDAYFEFEVKFNFDSDDIKFRFPKSLSLNVKDLPEFADLICGIESDYEEQKRLQDAPIFTNFNQLYTFDDSYCWVLEQSKQDKLSKGLIKVLYLTYSLKEEVGSYVEYICTHRFIKEAQPLSKEESSNLLRIIEEEKKQIKELSESLDNVAKLIK